MSPARRGRCRARRGRFGLHPRTEPVGDLKDTIGTKRVSVQVEAESGEPEKQNRGGDDFRF